MGTPSYSSRGNFHSINVCFITDADLNATVPDLKNATASKANDPPEISDMQSDLVAPASGPKPLQAKYTIRVKPKLKDGVPQIQEIRIMPPKSASTKGFVKPLMVLKQNVTKAMIENIEIDVPEKGVKYTSKPSVEVIEGDHRELLKVSKGEAVVENGAQKSDTKSEGMILSSGGCCWRQSSITALTTVEIFLSIST